MLALWLMRVAILVLTLPLLAFSGQSGAGAEDLPEGAGKPILIAACTECHSLKEVTKFKGYFGRDEWADVVRTMIAYGARLNDSQAGLLITYLTQHFGKPSSGARP